MTVYVLASLLYRVIKDVVNKIVNRLIISLGSLKLWCAKLSETLFIREIPCEKFVSKVIIIVLYNKFSSAIFNIHNFFYKSLFTLGRWTARRGVGIYYTQMFKMDMELITHKIVKTHLVLCSHYAAGINIYVAIR